MTAASPQSFSALRHPRFRGYFLCAAFGLGGSLIGIHLSLAISAAVLLAITALFLLMSPQK